MMAMETQLPDAVVWDNGGIVKPRSSSLRVNGDHASLPGPWVFGIALGVLWLLALSLWMMSLGGGLRSKHAYGQQERPSLCRIGSSESL